MKVHKAVYRLNEITNWCNCSIVYVPCLYFDASMCISMNILLKTQSNLGRSGERNCTLELIQMCEE